MVGVILGLSWEQGKSVEFDSYLFGVHIKLEHSGWPVSYGEAGDCTVVTVPVFPFKFPSPKDFQIPYSGLLTVNVLVRFLGYLIAIRD